jgi:hypothetical protein
MKTFSWIVLLLVSLARSGAAGAAEPPAGFPDVKEISLEVQKILPEGWTVTQVIPGSAPADWFTATPRAGVRVEAGNGTESADVWFLPVDWIGIRKRSNRAPRTTYWEGILGNDRCKTITETVVNSFPERVQGLFHRNMTTPSLVNGGYRAAERNFEGRFEKADERAQALIAKHATTPAEFAEAAHSLLVLGVPAKSVFVRAAQEVKTMDRDLFVSVLGAMGGADSFDTLAAILTDPTVPDQRRKYAALSLGKSIDNRAGPALHTALQQMSDEDALSAVVRAPALLRYKPAAPDVFALFQRSKNEVYKADVAQALAALDYKPAVPAIAGFERSLPTASDARAKAHLAWLRLTADWGKAGGGMRFLVMPPASAVIGRPMKVTVVVENVGGKPFETWNELRGVTIDGKTAPDNGMGGVSTQIYPGQVFQVTGDVSAAVTTPGAHTLECALNGARAKKVSFNAAR